VPYGARPKSKTMELIVDGVKRNLHYTIAAKLLKSGKAIRIGEKKEPEKKIIKKPGRKKIKHPNNR